MARIALLLLALASADAGLECGICKRLLPYVGTHECTSKCAGWVLGTSGICTDACEALIKYLPNQYPCE